MLALEGQGSGGPGSDGKAAGTWPAELPPPGPSFAYQGSSFPELKPTSLSLQPWPWPSPPPAQPSFSLTQSPLPWRWGGPPSLPFLGAPPSLPSLGSPSGCACGLTAYPAGTEPALARGRSTVPERWWRLGRLGPSGSDLRTRAPPRPEQAAIWGRSAWRWLSRKTSGTPPNRERAERPQCHKTPLGVTLCLMDVRWLTSQSGPGGPGCAHFTGLNLLPKDTTLGGLSEHLLLTPSWGPRTPWVPGWGCPCRGIMLPLDVWLEVPPPDLGPSPETALKDRSSTPHLRSGPPSPTRKELQGPASNPGIHPPSGLGQPTEWDPEARARFHQVGRVAQGSGCGCPCIWILAQGKGQPLPCATCVCPSPGAGGRGRALRTGPGAKPHWNCHPSAFSEIPPSGRPFVPGIWIGRSCLAHGTLCQATWKPLSVVSLLTHIDKD